jgi:hypothetical protein
MNKKGLTKTIFAVGLIAAILFASLLSYGITTTQFTVGRQELRGETGAQGPKGDTGDTGAAGAAGAAGARGPSGAAGATGAMGVTGATGAQGLQGLQGPAGLSIPDYDSGWIDITSKAGQSIMVNHNLNSVNTIVQITGKTTSDGQAHQKYYGLTNYIAGWNKTFGGILKDQAYSVVQANDGGFAVAVETQSFGVGGSWDFMLVKTDMNGNLQWNKTYGGAGTDYVNSIICTTDGGYLMVGQTNSWGSGGYDLDVIKTDSLGNMLWNRTYGGAGNDKAYGTVNTNDGGYAIVGNTDSYGAGLVDYWLVKLDSSGIMQWNKTYGGTNGDAAFSLVQTPDGGYAMTGGILSFGAGNHDYWLVKTDSAGNMQWNKTYGGPETDICRSLIRTSDGGFALAGFTNSSGNGGYDVWIVKTDGNGNMQWNKTYGGASDEYLYAYTGLIATTDGGYALAAATSSFGSGASTMSKLVMGIRSFDVWLVKIDSFGNMQWSKTFGGQGDDVPYSMIQTSDGAFAITGFTNSFGAGSDDTYLIKTSADGESGLAWTDSTANTLTLYRGANDIYWNYVRVQVWKIK